MINKLSITVLMDNTSNRDNPQLHSEHGLSLWIETDDKKILYDAGQSEGCCRNADKLGIGIEKADMFFLSHGHYDHSGAIPEILERNPTLSVYCHPGVFQPRYSYHNDGGFVPVGLRKEASGALHSIYDKIHWVLQPTSITEDIGITGPITRVNSFEDTGGDFYLDNRGNTPDTIEDDMSMWFRTVNGLVIVSGCCHSGLINTVSHVLKNNSQQTISALLGGFHLVHASENRLKSTCESLNNFSPDKLVMLHCTGDNAVQYLQTNPDIKTEKGYVGMRIEFC